MFFKMFLLSEFSDVTKIQLFFPALAAIQFQKILILLSVIGVLLDHDRTYQIKRTFYTTQGKALLFLVVWMVLSMPFSVWPGNSFRFLTEVFWKTVVSFLLIIAYGTSEKALEKMIWIFILSVILFALFATAFQSASRFNVIEAYDPNETAFMFVLALPFVFWKIVKLKGYKKILTSIIFIILLIGIIETQSRGGFLGLVAVAGIITIQYQYAVKKGLLSLLIIPVVIGAVLIYYGQDRYLARVATITDTESNYNYTAEEGRVAVWKRGVDMMTENPFLGVGVNGFASAEGKMHAGRSIKWSAAHNSFLQVGAELGVPGLLAFCIILWSLIKNARGIGVSLGETMTFCRYTSCALVGSLVGFIVGGFFLSVAYINLTFLLFGLAFAFVNITDKKNRTSEEALSNS